MIGVILILILVVGGLFYSKRRKEYVKENSLRYFKVISLRKYYEEAVRDYQASYTGGFMFDSKRKFDNVNNKEKALQSFLLERKDKIETTYDAIVMNQGLKNDFDDGFKMLSGLPTLTKYERLENKLITEIIQGFNIKTDAKVQFTVRYTSPKGRNSYHDRWDLNIEEAIDILDKIEDNIDKRTEFEIFRDAERAKMTAGRRYDILKRDGFTCQYCGANSITHGVTLHVDHIKPVAKGGLTENSNLQTLCETCNLGKGVKD